MTNILVTETRNTKAGIKKRTLSEHIQIGSISLTVTLIFFISVISIFYLFYINGIATLGYTLQNLEKARLEQIEESERWDMIIAKSRSLASVRTSLNLPMVSTQGQKDVIVFIRDNTAMATTKQK